MTDLTQLWRFNRPKLAAKLVDRAFAHERIALFGPRQTGKTSLLREELMPLAEERGARAIYVECWADRNDPLGSINYGLQKALDAMAVKPAGLKRTLSVPVKKVALAGAALEIGSAASRKIPASKFLQVDALLTSLLEETKQDLVLIFDEFQALAAGPEAQAATAALRSALTQASKRVGVVFSGSSEVMLLEAFARSRAPLYGFANPEPYPLLGEDFVAHVGRKFKAATSRELGQVEASRIFDRLGRQPEPFLNAVTNTMAHPRWGIDDGLKAMLDPNLRNKWTINWYALTDLQRVALRLVFEGRLPTAAQSLQWAADALGEAKVQPSSIARAIEALIDRGLVARELLPGGKRYVVSDPVMAAWLTQNKTLTVKV